MRQGKLIKKNLKPKGISQGSLMSGILSNIYMLKFDRAMQQLFGQEGQYFRYCDDMIFVIDASNEAPVRE